MKLVVSGHLNVEERHALGGFITREEVKSAILGALALSGHFPPQARPWTPGEVCYEGWQLVVSQAGVRLLAQRSRPLDPSALADSTAEDFATADEAVGRYLAVEIGGAYDGVPVR